MQHSSTASLWAGVSLPDTTQKKPVQPARNPATSVLKGPVPLDFVAGEHGTKPIEFGAFRNFSERSETARNDAMKHHPDQFKLLPLSEAAPMWLTEKKLHAKKARTVEAYQLYIDNLVRLLGNEKLCALHIGSIVTYQQDRMAEKTRTGKPPCASYVNHETNTLAQILKRADLWDLIEKHYKPLPTGNWTPPKVLSPEDEERFFRIAASNPDWKVAYWAVSLTNNTSAVGTELRNLKLKDVFMHHKPPKFHVPDDKVKNEFRARVIPLNEVAEKQMGRILDRAREHGARLPDHYIFPKRISRSKKGWDVTQPGSRSFIRHAFEEMRGHMGPGFEWLCPRNFRNQIITKLFEAGEPDETITSIAGHQSIKMSRFYSRIRIDRKFEALSALSPKKRAAESA